MATTTIAKSLVALLWILSIWLHLLAKCINSLLVVLNQLILIRLGCRRINCWELINMVIVINCHHFLWIITSLGCDTKHLFVMSSESRKIVLNLIWLSQLICLLLSREFSKLVFSDLLSHILSRLIPRLLKSVDRLNLI